MRWDPLLAAATARELAGSLSGARTRAILFDVPSRRVLLFLREHTVAMELHPLQGWLSILPAADPPPEARPLSGRIRTVRSVPDESILVLEIDRRGGGVEIVFEMVGNRWNALVVESESRTIRHVLLPREGGPRPLTVGAPYTLPPSTGRRGIDGSIDPSSWTEVTGPGAAPAEARARALLKGVAWTSSLNVGPLTAGDGPEAWKSMTDPENWGAFLLRTERGLQPYPIPVEGVECEAVGSLVEALARVREADEASLPPAGLLLPARLLERAADRVRREDRKAAALRRELAESGDPEVERSIGDLLLARFSEVPRGSHHVTLTDFDGATVEVELDPTLAPHENAAKRYDEAARLARARAALPERIATAESERDRWQDRLDRTLDGRMAPSELAGALGPDPRERSGTPGRAAPSLPYRRFVSSGGLEIRVGRGARHNDALTLHHSDPEDIWLHAHQAPGAHVILRWGRKEGPPRTDLLEAATLAALHSEARHSGSVPVVWTRRKHVRKPRKSAPGAVRPERIATLMVEPDPEVGRRLAPGAAEGDPTGTNH
ncbi:MAG: NFACT RNA binding domain-containing protein [Gemmatimonadota bacterium]